MSEQDIVIYEGFYQSFAEVEKQAEGFSGERWLDAQADLLKACRSGHWSRLFPADPYLALSISSLAETMDGPVKVLDVGGGLGVTHCWLGKVLPEGTRLDYLVVENEAVVRKAAEAGVHDQTPGLDFAVEIPDEPFDLVYFGSSIQYFENWQQAIDNALATGPETLLFSRTPLSGKGSFVSLQNYYESRIPVKVIGFKELVSYLSGEGYRLQVKSASASPVLGRYMPFPCRDIPEDYQFSYPSDVLFSRE